MLNPLDMDAESLHWNAHIHIYQSEQVIPVWSLTHPPGTLTSAQAHLYSKHMHTRICTHTPTHIHTV